MAYRFQKVILTGISQELAGNIDLLKALSDGDPFIRNDDATAHIAAQAREAIEKLEAGKEWVDGIVAQLGHLAAEEVGHEPD